MKLLAESKGIERLREVRSRFVETIRAKYEDKARPCSECMTPGIYCRDEHFVNVRITRLEAAAIRRRLAELGPGKLEQVELRAAAVVNKYGLDSADDPALKTYACPLFERGVGCLVHDAAKPLPCIAHACYENQADLPPDTLIDDGEKVIEALNRRVYREPPLSVPLPVAIARVK